MFLLQNLNVSARLKNNFFYNHLIIPTSDVLLHFKKRNFLDTCQGNFILIYFFIQALKNTKQISNKKHNILPVRCIYITKNNNFISLN